MIKPNFKDSVMQTLSNEFCMTADSRFCVFRYTQSAMPASRLCCVVRLTMSNYPPGMKRHHLIWKARMETQICSKCGDEKVMDLFAKNSNYVSGRSKTCKKCASIASQRSKDKTRDASNARRRESYAGNANVEAAKARARYAENRDAVRAQRKASRDADKDRHNAYTRESLARNPHLREADKLKKQLKRAEDKVAKLKDSLKIVKKQKSSAPKITRQW